MMIQLTTSCASSVDEGKGNTSNLLFSGQILPERNAGLNGAPSLKLEPGAACVAAVFDGRGSRAGKAAYMAASAFRATADRLRTVKDLEALYAKIHGDMVAASSSEAPLSAGAVAACVDGNMLSLASLGDCRVYLMRDRKLYMLSRESAEAAPEAAPCAPGTGDALGGSGAKPFTVKGALQPGDQLLLCTGWLCAALDAREILRTLDESATPSSALQQLARRAGARRGDIAAVLLKADGVEESEAPVEEPEALAEEPEAPVEEPKAPVEEPEAPVEKPEVPVEESEAPVEEPEVPVEESEAPAEESVEETAESPVKESLEDIIEAAVKELSEE